MAIKTFLMTVVLMIAPVAQAAVHKTHWGTVDGKSVDLYTISSPVLSLSIIDSRLYCMLNMPSQAPSSPDMSTLDLQKESTPSAETVFCVVQEHPVTTWRS